MGEKDHIGKQGELTFGVLIMQRCAGRYWFDPDLLVGKTETKDCTVNLIDPVCGQGTFYVQVKSTSKGYRGKGKKRRLKVNVTKADVLKLKRVPGPTFVAGIDVETATGYMLAITAKTRNRGISGIPCRHRIDCGLIPGLWKKIDDYWRGRNMLAAKSLLT